MFLFFRRRGLTQHMSRSDGLSFETTGDRDKQMGKSLVGPLACNICIGTDTGWTSMAQAPSVPRKGMTKPKEPNRELRHPLPNCSPLVLRFNFLSPSLSLSLSLSLCACAQKVPHREADKGQRTREHYSTCNCSGVEFTLPVPHGAPLIGVTWQHSRPLSDVFRR